MARLRVRFRAVSGSSVLRLLEHYAGCLDAADFDWFFANSRISYDPRPRISPRAANNPGDLGPDRIRRRSSLTSSFVAMPTWSSIELELVFRRDADLVLDRAGARLYVDRNSSDGG
ncbi:unnamed protein product [Microthlaspi erraticum]|uniref:Uncharacterized protein n=1 Tax=Microthlaspi erraticum TaxID=1685480 RepID=A0A6D2J1R9_9BRAS|nr:unnamed protein product [Microthlaspi erraticum]